MILIYVSEEKRNSEKTKLKIFSKFISRGEYWIIFKILAVQII